MDVPAELSSRLIGSIFVEKGLITQEQLEDALRLQKETGERLGEIVVGEFGVPRLELASVLAEQWAEVERGQSDYPRSETAVATSSAELLPVAPKAGEPLLRRPIGEIFVERGFVSDNELRDAIELQRKTGQRLGEVLVEQGALSRLDLASALAEQWANLQRTSVAAAAERAVPAIVPAAGLPGDAATLLDARLSEVERTVASVAGKAELDRMAAELHGALATLEQRLSESVALDEERAMAAIMSKIDAMRTVVDEPLERLAALEQRLADGQLATGRDDQVHDELHALSARVDVVATSAAAAPELDEVRETLSRLVAHETSTVDEFRALQSRVEQLAAMLAESSASAAQADVTDKLDAVAGQVEAAQTGLASLASRLDELGGLSARIDGVAAQLPSAEVVEELRRSLTELAEESASNAGRPDPADQLAALGARLDQVSARLEDLSSVVGDVPSGPRIDAEIAALARRFDELAASVAASPADLGPVVDDLRARLDEFQRQVGELAGGDDAARFAVLESAVAELRASLPELAAASVGSEVGVVAARLDELEERLRSGVPSRDDLGRLEDELAQRAASLEGQVEGVRLGAVDPAVIQDVRERLDALDARVGTASDDGELQERLSEIERRLANTAGVEAVRTELRNAAEASAAERESLERSLMDRIHEMVGVTAPVVDELGALGRRIDEVASRAAADENARVAVDELRERIDAAVVAGGQIEQLGQRLAALEGASSDATEATERLHAVEQALTRLDAIEGRVAALPEFSDEAVRTRVEDLRATVATELEQLGVRLEESRALGESHVQAFDERLAGLSSRREMQELRDRLDDLEGRLARAGATDELAALRAEVESSVGDVRSEAVATAEQAARAADEAAARHEQGIAALREELETREHRADELAASLEGRLRSLRTELDGLAGNAAAGEEWRSGIEASLNTRVDGLERRVIDVAETLRTHAASNQSDLDGRVEELGRRVEELVSSGADDAEGARIADVELAARIDDVAVRAAASAAAAEGALRREQEQLAERLVTLEGGEAGAMEAARAEVERLMASVGWRLERLEESLAAEETTGLQDAVQELERRLDTQAAQAAEQVRVTEKALRKGLASLGAQLSDTHAAHAETGDALRRSIERLGAAVTDADRRIGDDGDESPGTAMTTAAEFVAFAPTDEGYRLVVVEGAAPEVGDEIEVAEHPGRLVVTRVGRSPLPLDTRPCAYLDRVLPASDPL